MTRVLAIADDLTGALEAGALFAQAGMGSVVTTGAGHEFDEPVIVIDTETRHVSPEAAESVVASRALDWPSLVYKKTDSTLRGNIGPELRALQRRYGGPIAYVPAYPAMGRTVIDGWLYVDGIPLSETSFARDALNPVHDGNVRALAGPECDSVVFDGRDDDDVARAARTIVASGAYRIVAGPAAIAGALADIFGTPCAIEWPAVRSCLVVNGSRHEMSRLQIEYALQTGTIALDDGAPWRLCCAETLCPVSWVRRLLAERDFDGLMVFGGDTAFGIIESLGMPLLRPIAEILPGVPVSRIDGRRELLITKAGGFGTPDLIERLRSKLDESGR